MDHGISDKTVTPALPMLEALGMIEIETGPRLGKVFSLSSRWSAIDAVEATRLVGRESRPTVAQDDGRQQIR